MRWHPADQAQQIGALPIAGGVDRAPRTGVAVRAWLEVLLQIGGAVAISLMNVIRLYVSCS